ncbi:MAG: ABC transporter permease [Anaerolineae bacterium]
MILPYLYQLRNSLRTQFTYPAWVFWGLLYNLVNVLPQVFLWRALYIGKEQVAGATLAQMLTYVVLSNLVGILTNAGGAEDIEERMKSGNIGLDLLRPVSVRGLFVARNLGAMVGNLALTGIPQLVVSIIIVGGILPPVSWAALGCFLLTALLGMGVQISLQLFLGTFSFWFINTWLMGWVLDFSWLVLSGSIVPLWLLPRWLLVVAQALPFQAAQFIPIAVYLGKIPLSDVPRALLVQGLWIAGLLGAQTLLWRRGLRRIVVLGG